MKKIFFLLFLVFFEKGIFAVDKIIVCNEESCYQEDEATLFEKNNILPGQSLEKMVRVINNRKEDCSLTISNVDENNLDLEKVFNFSWSKSPITIYRESYIDMNMGIEFDRFAENEWADKLLNINLNFNFNCEDVVIKNPVTGIVINEIYPSPSGGNQEWIEVKNVNNFKVILEGWKIDDVADGGGAIRPLPEINIDSNGYYIFRIDNGYFNNSGDSVRLINNEDVEVDSYTYSSISGSQSWSRQSNDNWCKTLPSMGETNNYCGVTGQAIGLFSSLILGFFR